MLAYPDPETGRLIRLKLVETLLSSKTPEGIEIIVEFGITRYSHRSARRYQSYRQTTATRYDFRDSGKDRREVVRNSHQMNACRRSIIGLQPEADSTNLSSKVQSIPYGAIYLASDLRVGKESMLREGRHKTNNGR